MRAAEKHFVCGVKISMNGFGMNLGITLLLAGIYLWCMRKQGRTERIRGLSCFLVAGCFLDRLCGLVMEGIIQEGTREQMWLAGSVLSKSMTGILLLVICSARREASEDGNKNADKGMDYIDKLTVAGAVFFWYVLTVTGIFLGRGMWTGQDTGSRQEGILVLDFIWTFMLSVILSGFYLSVYRYRRSEQGRQEERSRHEERRQTETYLYTIESNYQRTRELWHDLRNHISLLHLLLQEEKYEQMRDYLRVFGEEVDQIALPAKSGNLIVDAVLADKAARAKRENITVEIKLCDLSGLPLKPDEICSLFGNLLDNAIEACLRAEGERKIIVTCRVREKEICLSVRNTLSEEDITQGKQLISIKRGKENVVGHGLGLRSVERVVNRYGGEFVTEANEGMFTAAVWLPGKEADMRRDVRNESME